jgi:hypothetical protein
MSNEKSVRLNDCAVLSRTNGYTPMVSFEGKHYSRDEYVPISILGDRFAIDYPPKLFTASLFVASCMGTDFKRITEWPALAVEFVFPNPLERRPSYFEQSKPSSEA